MQGEAQKPLDVLANEIILRSCEWGGLLAGMASEEMDEPYPIPAEYPRGRYLLLFDPLDGSSNIDVNVSVGTHLLGAALHGRGRRADRGRLPAAGHRSRLPPATRSTGRRRCSC